jgi:hypothetical protein
MFMLVKSYLLSCGLPAAVVIGRSTCSLPEGQNPFDGECFIARLTLLDESR